MPHAIIPVMLGKKGGSTTITEERLELKQLKEDVLPSQYW